MSSFTVRLNPGAYYSGLPQFRTVHTLQTLKEFVSASHEEKYWYPVEFITHPIHIVAAPDVEDWVSGEGLRVYKHHFFFEEMMTQEWAHDISACFQGHHARYIGVHIEYCNHVALKPTVQVADFSPDALCAWMCLFWDKNRGFDSCSLTDMSSISLQYLRHLDS